MLLLAAFTFSIAQVSSIPSGSAGGGTGTVTSVNGSNGVATTTGSAFTDSGTLWANWPRNAQTGTSYALVTGDRGKVVTFSNAGAIAVTIAQAGTTGFETGWLTVAKNIGAGTVTITPTTSTVDGAATITLLTGDWALISSDGTNYETVNNKAISGSGVTVTTSRTGKQIAADTAVMESRANQQASGSTYSVTAGSSTVYTAALTPSLTAYTNGGTIRVKWDETCGANPTINVDSQGARKIYKRNGTSASTQLGAGECIANQINVLTYNSSLDSGTGGFETDIGGGGTATITGLAPYEPFGPISNGDTASVGSANRVVYLPFVARSPNVTYADMYGYSTTNDGHYALGIYESDTCTLLFQTNTVTGGGASGALSFTWTSPSSLTIGKMYFLGVTSDNANTNWFSVFTVPSGGRGYQVWNIGLTSSTYIAFYDSSASSYSAPNTTMPASCTGGATRTAISSNKEPWVMLR